MKIIWVKMCNTYTGQYSGKDYGFKAVDDKYEAGDFVVVDAANLLQVAKVTKVDDWTPESKATKYVVGKVEVAEHMERVKNDKKVAELKKKIEKRAKELQTIQMYELLAASDSEMRALLDEYKAAGGGNCA